MLSFDIEYYDKHELNKSLQRHLNLYTEKLNNKKQEKIIKKAANRCFSLMAIATILLYSIQQLLTNQLANKE